MNIILGLLPDSSSLHIPVDVESVQIGLNTQSLIIIVTLLQTWEWDYPELLYSIPKLQSVYSIFSSGKQTLVIKLDLYN